VWSGRSAASNRVLLVTTKDPTVLPNAELQQRHKEYVEYVESIHDQNLVTIIRYEISAHIAVITKDELQQINQLAAEENQDDIVNLDASVEMLDSLDWEPWHSYPFDSIADFGYFNVEGDRGYVAFQGDVAHFADDCLGMLYRNWEWKAEWLLWEDGGLKVTTSKA
jgi:hypothetical protein